MINPSLIGIVYNPLLPQAKDVVSSLKQSIDLRDNVWVCSTTDLDFKDNLAKESRVIITVGGDGTILRSAKIAVPYRVPILGINLGRLGFMTELKLDEALEKVPLYLEREDTWVEERTMIQMQPVIQGTSSNGGLAPSVYHALNDVVLGRGAVARLVRIRTEIDGAYLTTYAADAVIVATATGSTGYNLSVGGPILSPTSTDFILKPVAPHIGLASGLVVPSTSLIELTVETGYEAILSLDGHMDLPLAVEDGVTVKLSPHKALFLRAHSSTNYYATLARRLGFDTDKGSVRAIEY